MINSGIKKVSNLIIHSTD